MRPTLEDGLRALRESTEMAKSIRVDLDDDYLANIARVEALPENQSGADKSWAGSWNERTQFVVDGVEIPVAGLLDIIMSKRGAGRDKDILFLAAHRGILEQLLKREESD